jgi:DNA-binding CsgD family transcriptional regulator
MDIEERTHELIALAYDAALAPEKWQQVMAGVVRTIGTNTALLREVNYTTGEVGLYKTLGFDPAFTKAYCEHFVHLDFFAPILMREPVGTVARGDQAVPWEQQRGTEFCNDYLLAQNNRYCLGITLERANNHHLLFALQRSKQQGDFTDNNLHLLRTLAPHMTRAISIHRHMLTITTQQQWALSALDKLKIGVILLDDYGTPGFINKKAEFLLSANYGLSISGKKLSLSNPLESARLQSFIANAAKAASGRQCTAGGSLRATNHLGNALHIHVIPLPRDTSERPWGLALPRGCVAVFISASGSTHLRIETLSALYGFTSAEAKLASLLADGLSLEDAANTLGISIQTVRSQLKAVFAKTQVSRQAELVALLLTDMLSHQLTD